MSDEEHVKAVFLHAGGQVQALMRRRFDHLPGSIWSLLTDAARLPLWLAPGTIETRLGGAVRLDFADSGTVVDSTITAYAPGRLLEYSWSGRSGPPRPVRWELAPDGEGTVLTLTLRVPEDEDAGRACAGWEAHLEMLEAALEGVPIKFPFETFKTWRDAYRAELARPEPA